VPLTVRLSLWKEAFRLGDGVLVLPLDGRDCSADSDGGDIEFNLGVLFDCAGTGPGVCCFLGERPESG